MRLPDRAFYYIRHGQTDANLKGLTCGGDWDIPLNETGLAQARSAAGAVKTLQPRPSALCVSPMLRAQQTANVLNEILGLPLHTVKGLEEWYVGEWEYKPWGDVPNPFQQRVDPPGGETRTQFEHRVLKAVTDALDLCAGHVLVVAHGAVGHVLFSVLGHDGEHLENATPYLLEPPAHGDGKWRVSKVSELKLKTAQI